MDKVNAGNFPKKPEDETDAYKDDVKASIFQSFFFSFLGMKRELTRKNDLFHFLTNDLGTYTNSDK